MLSTREAAAIKSRIACAIGCRCISNGVVMLKMKIEKWLQLMSEASCLEEEGIPAGVHRTGRLILEGFCESSTSESIYYDGLQKNSKAAS